MSQVTYESEKVSKKRVYYTGSDTLAEGYLLCYDRDYGTAGDNDIARAYRVEKPATANLKYFAGVVDAECAGRTGPGWITIIEPEPNPGRLVNVYTDQNCTLGTTRLAVKDASYAAGAAASTTVTIATAMQTIDRSSTNGVALAQLEGASSIEVDAAANVAALTDSTGGSSDATLADVLASQTQGTVTDSTGGTGSDTFAAFSASYSQSEQNDFGASLADLLTEVRADIGNIISNTNNNFADINAQINNILTALKNANLMATS